MRAPRDQGERGSRGGRARNFGTAAAVGLISLTMVASVTSAAAAQRPARALPVTHLGDPQHIVVLRQENRSYDNYCGALHGQGQPASEAEPTTGNRSSTSTTITPFHQSAACDVADVNHSWTGTHAEINNGKMDGFATQNIVPADPTGRRA